MTDRLKGVIVTFEADIREDDAQEIINAILMIKGVVDVTTSIRSHDDIMNRTRIASELKTKVWEVFRDYNV